ncbi:MAG: alr0857 family protein [Spirulinaceae cyanobacterium]
MLKLTYTESGFRLEHLTQTVETWVNSRLVVALRAALPLTVEPSTAAFLLPAHVPGLDELEGLANRQHPGTIAIAQCDADYIEVCLNGTWVMSDLESEEGIFVTRLNDHAELLIYKLWQTAEAIAWINGD